MAAQQLSQNDVQERLIANRLGRWAGDTFVAEHCLLGKNLAGFIVYPKSDDPTTAARVQKVLQKTFRDAANVVVEKPVGEPRPAMGR